MDFPTVNVSGTGLIGVVECQGYAEYNQEGAPGWPGFSASILGNNTYVSSPADTGGSTYTLATGAFPSTFWADAGVAPGAVYTDLDASVYPATQTADQQNWNFLFPYGYECKGAACPGPCCSGGPGTNYYDNALAYATANAYATIIEDSHTADWPAGSWYADNTDDPNGFLVALTGAYDPNFNYGGTITWGTQPNYSIINIDDMPEDTVYTFNVANNLTAPFGLQRYDSETLIHYTSDVLNPSGLECSFKVYRGTIDQFTLNNDGTLSTTAVLLSTQSFTYDIADDPFNNNFSVQRSSAPPPVPIGGPFGEFGVPSGGGGNPPATQNNPGPPKAEAIFFIRRGTLNWHRGLTYGQKTWYTGLNKGQGVGYSWVGSFPWFLPPGVR